MTPITLLVLCCQAMASINYQDINNHDLANVGERGENMTENKKGPRKFLELIETISISKGNLTWANSSSEEVCELIFDGVKECLSSDNNSDGDNRKQVQINPEHPGIKSNDLKNKINSQISKL